MIQIPPSKAQSIIQTRALQQALVSALDPAGSVAHVFEHELCQTLPWLPPEAARQSVADMFSRRQAEHIRNAFLERPDQHTGSISPEKHNKLVQWLAQPHAATLTSPASADALIHIYQNIQAQRELHQGLAQIFQENGSFEQALASAIYHADASLLPEVTAQVAKDFTSVRRLKAQGVVEALAPQGEVERQAIALATTLRRAGDHPPPPAHPTQKPAEMMPDYLYPGTLRFHSPVVDWICKHLGLQEILSPPNNFCKIAL